MIRQIMTLATLCWMVAGCADEVIDRNGGKGEGRLLLTGIEVESVDTKDLKSFGHCGCAGSSPASSTI